MSPTVNAESVDGLLYDLSRKTLYAICAVALLETEMIVSGQKTPWLNISIYKIPLNRCFPTFIISEPRADNNTFLNPLITISIPLQLSLLWLKNLLTRLNRLPERMKPNFDKVQLNDKIK